MCYIATWTPREAYYVRVIEVFGVTAKEGSTCRDPKRLSFNPIEKTLSSNP